MTSRLSWLARPSTDRLIVTPTPIWGGVAIFLSFTLVALFRGLFNNGGIIVLIMSASCMFLVGFFDDMWKLPPRWKLLGQISCALAPVVILSNHQPTENKIFNVIIVLFWIIGITNAFNLLDNINGLAAGTALIASGFEAIFFFKVGEPLAALTCLGFLGSVLGFLVFNFPKGYVFMGDSGSLYIGFWLAATTMVSASAPGKHQLSTFLFPILVMAVPICDTTLVTLTRMLRGHPVSVGGTDHLSHRLVAYGFSQKSAVLTLWVASLVSGVLAISEVLYGASTLISAVTFLAVAVGLVSTYLTRFELHPQTGASLTDGSRSRISGWVRISSRALLDLILMIAAYYTAYLIRFNGDISRPDLQLFLSTIVELVLIKLAVFVAFGAYRPCWDYFGLRDAFRFIGASVIGSLSVTTYFSAVYRFAGFSRVVFVVDFLIFTLFALMFRFSFRLLDDIAPSNHRTNILIYGADSDGETALKLVSKCSRFRVVGFLDDDRTKRPFSIHSVPIRGGTQDLPRVSSKRHVKILVVTSSLNTEVRNSLTGLCNALGIRLLQFEVSLRDVTKLGGGLGSAETPVADDFQENKISEPSLTAFPKLV